MMQYNGSKIQILDLPGIVEGASKGRGLGKKVLSVARNADLVLMVLDVFQPELLGILETELHEVGIRINKKFPQVHIEKAHIGGLSDKRGSPNSWDKQWSHNDKRTKLDDRAVDRRCFWK